MLGNKVSLNKLKKQTKQNKKKLKASQAPFLTATLFRLEINYQKKKTVKQHKHMEGKQYASKEPWITEEVKEEIQKYLKTKGNETKPIENLWDATKAVLRGKVIAIQSYHRNQENHK